MTTRQLTRQLRALDRTYSWEHFLGAGQEGEVRYLEGRDVLFTAPHSVRQARRHNGRLYYKPGDRWTGSIAEILAKRTGAGALTLVGAKGDAARDDPHPFRAKLGQLIDSNKGRYGLVIDLHGMNDTHGVDVSIGLGAYPTPAMVRLAANLAQAAEGAGLFWAINPDRLQAAGLTITSFAQRHDVDALQVELAADIRNPRSGSGDRLARCLNMLSAIVPNEDRDPDISQEVP